MARCQVEYPFRLYSYVLMPNHVHLLLEVVQIPLAKIIQALHTGYTQYFNRRHRRVGHLFQGRYRAIVCDRDAYLLVLSRYIHLNPVRAGLVEDPGHYPWSSFRAIVQGPPAEGPRLEIQLVLGLLGNTPARGRAAYRRFVLEAVAAGHEQAFYPSAKEPLLGEDEFKELVANRAAGQGFKSPLVSRRRPSLQGIAREVARAFDVSVRDLRSVDKRPANVTARDAFALIARDGWGFRGTTMAEYLGCHGSVVARGALRMRRRMAADGGLLRKVEGVMERCGRIAEKEV